MSFKLYNSNQIYLVHIPTVNGFKMLSVKMLKFDDIYNYYITIILKETILSIRVYFRVISFL